MSTTLTNLYKSGDFDVTQIGEIASSITDNNLVKPPCWGKTFTILMLMLGEAQLGDKGNIYLYIGKSPIETELAKEEFLTILEVEGFEVTKGTNKLFVSDSENLVQSFHFLSVGYQLSRFGSTCTYDHIFMDLDPETHDRHKYTIQGVYENLRGETDGTQDSDASD